MAGWNFAELWETAAEAHPDAPALVQGERRLTWAEVDHRADGVARWLVDLGVQEQDKVAQYLYNCPEYMESMFACYKAGLAPVNTNYRYRPAELRYLWDNADAVAVVFHGCFAERIEPLRRELPKVRGWLWVDDGSGPCPSWAVPYEEAARSAPVGVRTRAAWGRSGDHLYLLYTGGTTGMPKGVMWRQDDLVVLVAGLLLGGLPDEPDYELFRSRLPNPPPVGLPACPLMHGTGALVSKGVWTQGGCVVTLTGRRYDPVELLETIGRERVNVLAIVGDAFAKPMLRALEAEPERFDVSSLMAITSSGVMWSEETKRGLLARNPNMVLLDAFSSSEALGMGASVSGGGTAAATAKFQLGEKAVVIGEDGRLVEPGSGEIGMVGVGGRIPLGYYKDPEKTAKTFKVVDGKRYSIPGDFARVEADGTITLLGRGSVCINTAGEKVFPEEVEEVVKRLPEVADCVVVGVPDERWGEAVTALVEPQPGATLDEATVVAHVRGELADYKVPKRVLVVDSIGRAPNGKVDYRRCRERAMEAVGVQVG
ncbi:acyl-CoA synthetase [Aciditerrimonas ferrireducens]|uniref:acyl-CoA synthetase n=1 Tax=Aciditerrimonas ferrireducens TaxID=667306 RepID=UPI0020056E0E|nr:acyl-CoA synthetase [Aciditerrimonas ferrireducens]MCK4178113.1 acyl-CoA synthetase [Aciditerrimonas ferrireducens]